MDLLNVCWLRNRHLVLLLWLRLFDPSLLTCIKYGRPYYRLWLRNMGHGEERWKHYIDLSPKMKFLRSWKEFRRRDRWRNREIRYELYGILSSHGGGYEEFYILECNYVNSFERNRHFRGIYLLRLQGLRINEAKSQHYAARKCNRSLGLSPF
jgi:hypothetical protein